MQVSGNEPIKLKYHDMKFTRRITHWGVSVSYAWSQRALILHLWVDQNIKKLVITSSKLSDLQLWKFDYKVLLYKPYVSWNLEIYGRVSFKRAHTLILESFHGSKTKQKHFQVHCVYTAYTTLSLVTTFQRANETYDKAAFKFNETSYFA